MLKMITSIVINEAKPYQVGSAFDLVLAWYNRARTWPGVVSYTGTPMYTLAVHHIPHRSPILLVSQPICNTPMLKVHILDPFRQTIRAVEIRIAAPLDRAFFERFYDRKQR